MRILGVVVSALLVAACAAQPVSPPGSVDSEVTRPPPAAAESPTPPANQVVTVQEARKAGYRIVTENGETLYCREQLKTGSHLRKETICLTAAELETARAASQRNLEQMQKRIPPPQGT